MAPLQFEPAAAERLARLMARSPLLEVGDLVKKAKSGRMLVAGAPVNGPGPDRAMVSRRTRWFRGRRCCRT
jgi:hypothetical protein